MYLHDGNPVDVSSYTSLQFSLYTTQPNQKYAVALYDENYRQLTSAINLDSYSAPSVNAWKSYSIPLADLGAAGKKINGIVIQETSGHAQPVVYIDSLAFGTGTGNTVSSNATVTPAVSSVPAPVVKKFTTLPPGSVLPSGADCAAQVRRSAWEPRPENYQADHTPGSPLTAPIDGTTAEGNAKFQGRIDGNFTGTTDEIMQWGACKWGLDEDIIRSVAAQESWWRQATLGDINSSGQPESYGLLQVRKTYHTGTFPLSSQSVPFNVDYALGWRRACMEGYFNWIPSSAKGDEWGCVGLWFSGKWYDGDPNVDHSGANWYITKVKDFLASKPWLQPGF
jgi:autotransporter family porin